MHTALLFLIGCASLIDASPERGDAWTGHDGDAPRPAVGELTLDLGPAFLGSDLVFTVSGALSYEGIWLIRSTAGLGPGPCADVIGGGCLDIRGPFVVQTRIWTDIDGSGSLSMALDEPRFDGTELCYQAVAVRGLDGIYSELAPPVCRVIGLDTDGDGVVDPIDACPGFDDAFDRDEDGEPDDCDPCPDDPGADIAPYYLDEDGDGVGAGEAVPLCPVDLTPVCGSMPFVELTSGDLDVPMDCAPGDYECQSEQMCEFVTGIDCIRQDYDCYFGTNGSFYPVGTPGGSTFNFAIHYDFDGTDIVELGGAYGGYGNICCGDEGYCDTYELRKDHAGSGWGHWGLDADGATCGAGDSMWAEVGGDPCPTDPEDRDEDLDRICDIDEAPVCGSMPFVELTSGDLDVPMDCAPGDYECQSEQMCEFVTGIDCIRQDYDCYFGTNGSFYPVGTPGGSTFNFAIHYDFDGTDIVELGGAYGGYGNICCGDEGYCDTYALRKDHLGSGWGHWGLDADGVGCL